MWLIRFARNLTLTMLRMYQRLISPILLFLGCECRFFPSCSAYAARAIERDGVVRGCFRAAGRLMRCHPLHPGGFDPP